MRFRTLHLLKYGHFDGCQLVFDKGGHDFHLIVGPNEVGKSTSMEAVSDFLFGFPHGKAMDYRFDAALLRVAATVEEGTATLTGLRKRGRTGTLTDDAGQPIAENQLIAMLHGQTRDRFRLQWSLNHTQLRLGGKSIAEAKDDVGQAIFSAGSGLMDVTASLRRLDEESDAIWKKNKTSSTWHKANRTLQTALQLIKNDALKPKDWLEAREALDLLDSSKKELLARRKILQTQERTIQRTRRLATPLRRWQDLQTLLGPVHTTGVVSPGANFYEF